MENKIPQPRHQTPPKPTTKPPHRDISFNDRIITRHLLSLIASAVASAVAVMFFITLCFRAQ